MRVDEKEAPAGDLWRAEHLGANRQYTFPAASSELTIEVQTEQNQWAAPAGSHAPYVRATIRAADHYQTSLTAGSATVPIADDDSLLVDLAPRQATVAESAGAAEFVVRRVYLPSADGEPVSYTHGPRVVLSATVAETGSVIAGGVAAAQVVLEPGDAQAVMQVPLDDDEVTEAHSAVTVTVVADQSFEVHGSDTATVTVSDDEPNVVSIFAGAVGVAEGDSGTFRLLREGNLDAPLTVNVVAQEQFRGADGAHGPRRLASHTIPAGGSEMTLTVATTPNDWASPPEVEAPSLLAFILGGLRSPDHGAARMKIIDDDPLLVDIVARAAAVTESAGYAEFAVRRVYVRSADEELIAYPHGPRVELTVGVTHTGGFVDGEQDDVAVVLEPGTSEAVVRVPLADDAVVEADGSVTLTINADDSFQVHGSGAATVTVSDDDASVTIAADAVTVEESVPPSFTLTRTGDLSRELAVTVDEVTNDLHVVTSRRHTVTFASGSATARLTRYLWDDFRDEDDGSVTMTIAAGDDYVVDAAATAAVTVTDNDPSPELSIHDMSLAEGAGELELEVALSFDHAWETTARTVTAAYATADGTAGAGGDYTATSGALTFVPTLGNRFRPPSQTIRVPLQDDAVHERGETFTVTLSAVVAAALAAATATVTIADDDLPVVSLEPLGAEEMDDGGTIRWRLRRDGDLSEPLHVYLERVVYLDDPRPGKHNGRGPVTGAMYTIPAGAATVEGELTTGAEWVGALGGRFVQVVQYADYAPAGLTPAPSAYLIPYDAEEQVVTLRPALPTVTIEAAAAEVTEGQDAVFTLRSYGPRDADLAIAWGWSRQEQGSPQGTADAVLPASGADHLTVRVTTDDDAVVNPDGAVWATILAAADDSYRLPRDASFTRARVSVRNDDLPAVTIAAAAPATVTEGTAAAFILTRSGDSGALTVAVAVTESGEVLAGAPPARVSFASGQLTTTLTAATDDDDHDEADSVVSARVESGAGYTVGAAASAGVTVADNDRAQLVYFDDTRTGDAVNEGEDAVFYLERRSRYGADDWRVESRGPLVVNLSAQEDYGSHVAGELPGSVRFPAGASSVELRIPTQDDAVGERHSAVEATILAGANYRRGDGDTYPRSDGVIIRDNDTGFAAVGIEVNAARVTEGADLVYTLTRHGGDLNRDLAVRLTIKNKSLRWWSSGRSPFATGEGPDGSGNDGDHRGGREHRLVDLVDG